MKTTKTVINDRDKQILKYLFEQKVASQENIYRRFFPQVAKSIMVRRLQKLIKGKFIGKTGRNFNNRLQVYYFLLPYGLEVVRPSFTFDIATPYFKSGAIDHDLELAEIRMGLETYPMVERFYSENYLQNCCLEDDLQELIPLRELNSDGAILVKTEDGQFFAAIEYERSKRTYGKYVEKFTDYYLSQSITAVFYICEGREITNFIAKIDREVKHSFKAKIYTTIRKNMAEKEKKLPFKNSKGDVFNLR